MEGNNNQILKILKDIRFWIVFFFLIRLIGITNAPLEVSHSWRQAFTNMVSRNFLEIDPNILYPRIDKAGSLTGIVASEFPIFNYLIYLVSLVFDYDHWYGRLINLIVSSLGIFYFFKLLKNLFDKQIAFNSSIILTVSIWFAYSRKIMPDTFSVSLIIIALFLAYKYFINGKKINALLFFVISSIGLLAKIPSLCILSVLAILPWIRSISIQRRFIILTLAALAFSVACMWYLYWIPILNEKYHYTILFPRSIEQGIQEILPLFAEFIEKFYFDGLHSYIGFGFVLIGSFYFLKTKNRFYVAGILFMIFTFLVFAIKTGSVFPLHAYYVIPIVPVLALLSAYGISKIPLRIQFILIAIIGIEGIANQQHDFFIKDSEKYRLELESITHDHISSDELVIINGGQSYQDMYFAHCKGWSLIHDEINENALDSLNNLGAKFLILDKHKGDFETSIYPLLFDNDHYSIYVLKDEY